MYVWYQENGVPKGFWLYAVQKQIHETLLTMNNRSNLCVRLQQTHTIQFNTGNSSVVHVFKFNFLMHLTVYRTVGNFWGWNFTVFRLFSSWQKVSHKTLENAKCRGLAGHFFFLVSGQLMTLCIPTIQYVCIHVHICVHCAYMYMYTYSAYVCKYCMVSRLVS